MVRARLNAGIPIMHHLDDYLARLWLDPCRVRLFGLANGDSWLLSCWDAFPGDRATAWRRSCGRALVSKMCRSLNPGSDVPRRDVTHWMHNRTWWPHIGDPNNAEVSPYLGQERLGSYISDLKGYLVMVEDGLSGGAGAGPDTSRTLDAQQTAYDGHCQTGMRG